MTDEMIKDVYKDDNLEDLYQQYYDIDAQVEKRKGRRILVLHVVFLAAYFGILCIISKPDSLGALAGLLIPSIFLTCGHFWINYSLFSWMISKAHEDNDRRDFIAKRIKFARDRH